MSFRELVRRGAARVPRRPGRRVSSTDALSIKLVSDAALLLALRTLSIFCSTSGNSYQLNG